MLESGFAVGEEERKGDRVKGCEKGQRGPDCSNDCLAALALDALRRCTKSRRYWKVMLVLIAGDGE